MDASMLHQQAPDLWTVDHELRMPGGVPFPTRMTVIRLPDRSLALVSPVPISDALAAELGALGDVSHVVAPNRLHHLHLPAALARYPGARLLGAEGLSDKEPGLVFEPLAVERSAALRDVLTAELIQGAPKMSETVLCHRPSGTLIVTDFVFNIEMPPAWTTGLMLRMTGTHGRLAQSRAWSFLLEDRALARASSERVLEWDFDRLIVAHGSVISSGAKARLAPALTRTAPGAAASQGQLATGTR